eukprot:scaffold8013_cov124-Isochrysis_galbana.AAC.9
MHNDAYRRIAMTRLTLFGRRSTPPGSTLNAGTLQHRRHPDTALADDARHHPTPTALSAHSHAARTTQKNAQNTEHENTERAAVPSPSARCR